MIFFSSGAARFERSEDERSEMSSWKTSIKVFFDTKVYKKPFQIWCFSNLPFMGLQYYEKLLQSPLKTFPDLVLQ